MCDCKKEQPEMTEDQEINEISEKCAILGNQIALRTAQHIDGFYRANGEILGMPPETRHMFMEAVSAVSSQILGVVMLEMGGAKCSKK